MVAIYLDDEKYLKSHSFTHRKPGSILVDSLPDETDPEKLRCYKWNGKKLVFDSSKWAQIQAERIKEDLERKAREAIEEIRNRINAFKAELESSDYKIIKCFEYSLLNRELPYDLDALHAERQAMRDKINELEIELSKE